MGVYTFMGNAIGSAVPPIWFLLTWEKANAIGAILGAWVGLILAIVAWVVTAFFVDTECDENGTNCKQGIISVETLGALDSCLAGNLVAILTSGLIHIALSCCFPDKTGGLAKLNKELKKKMVEDDMSGLDDDDYSHDELAAAKTWITRWGWSLTIVLVVIWPLLSLPAGVFSKDYFAFWIFIAIVWGFVAAFLIIFWPLLESIDDIINVLRGMVGLPKLDKSGLALLHGGKDAKTKHHLHGRVFQLEQAIQNLTGKHVAHKEEPEGCM